MFETKLSTQKPSVEGKLSLAFSRINLLIKRMSSIIKIGLWVPIEGTMHLNFIICLNISDLKN